MLSQIYTSAFIGINILDISVQVHLANGVPAFNIVGLANKAVSEAKERVRASLSYLGITLPAKRITINLSPSDITKEGNHYDLPIALCLLSGLGIVPVDELSEFSAMGELSLNGDVNPVAGVLPSAIYAMGKGRSFICPSANLEEAGFATTGEKILPAGNLLDLINHFKGNNIIDFLKPSDIATKNKEQNHHQNYPNFSEIKGQAVAKRASEIAATGGHNMLLSGPPGSGKTMIARAMLGILPKLTGQEMLNISMINSIAGVIKEEGLRLARPFRDPHHNCSMPAMVGGGVKASPGEVTLADNGILFLDELPEFSRQVLDSLRQPLETGSVTIARANSHINYPANFQLIAAQNPCRCGHLGTATKECSKAPICGQDYQAKLSGPLLDRIDLFVNVKALMPEEIYNEDKRIKQEETSEEITQRVQNAREIQKQRYERYLQNMAKDIAPQAGSAITDIGVDANMHVNKTQQDLYQTRDSFIVNARADGDFLKAITPMQDDAKDLLIKGMRSLSLSMRGHNRILRLARTIADLAESEVIEKSHIAEALSYRNMLQS